MVGYSSINIKLNSEYFRFFGKLFFEVRII